ncbi:MAG: hypothetical protein U0U66_07780 [Cytophagaceae bacterium]
MSNFSFGNININEYKKIFMTFIYTGFFQILIQTLTFLSGIFLIRFLGINEYAYYTITITVLTTLTTISDSGIMGSVMSIVGSRWNDKNYLGQVIFTAQYLRRRLALLSLCIGVPILVYLLYSKNASYFNIITHSFALVIIYFLIIQSGLFETAYKLTLHLKKLQSIQIITQSFKAIFIIVLIYLIPLSFIAIICIIISQWLLLLLLKNKSESFVQVSECINEETKNELLLSIKKVLPSTIYYAFYGQITLLLISFFGNIESVAQLGGLTRLAMLLSLVTSILNLIVVPRFSRFENNKQEYYKKLNLIIVGLILLSLSLCLLVYIFPIPILSILGPSFLNLEKESLLITISSCISMINGIVYNIALVGKIIVPSILIISYNTIVLIALILLFDMSKISNILFLNIYSSIAIFILFNSFIFYKLNYIKNEN